MKLEKTYQISLEIMFWIFVIWISYLLILTIFNHSPTDIQTIFYALGIMGALQTAMITYIFAFSFKVAKFMGKTEARLDRIEEDIKEIKDGIKETKSDLAQIKSYLAINKIRAR